MFKKYQNVMQDGLMDCGVCSLLTIIKTYGGDVSKEYLRELTCTNKSGTNAFYLLDAGKKLGFDTKALKGDIYELPDAYLPCIAHVVLNEKYQHFVVIQNINKKKGIITISDPASGIIKYKLDEYKKISTNQYLIFIPSRPVPILDKNHELYQSILQLIIKYKTIFISIFIFSLMYTIFNIVTSFTFQFIIENVINFESKTNLYFIVLFIFFVYLLKSLVDWMRNNLLNFINHVLDRTLITSIYKHILLLPYLYYKNRTTGEVIARINDLGDVKDAVSSLFITVFVDLVLVLFVLISLFKINFNLTMIGIGMCILYIIVIKCFNKIMHGYIKRNQEEIAEVNSYMVESINNIDTVKSLGVEEITTDKFNTKYSTYSNTSYKFQKLYYLENLIKDIINDIGLVLIMFIAVLYVLDGSMSIGSVITYNAMIVYFLEPIKNIIQLELLLKKTKISIERVTELYEVKKEKLELDCNYCGNRVKGNIRINNLNYSYYGRNNILNGVNLDILEGNKVMIFGNSGSGKSTLGKIIMKFLNVERDKVFIDDKDINDYNTLDIRREICYIGQNENLFTDSVYNNIVMNRNISYDKFLEVVSLTKVDEIIKNRSASYEMLLEENGFNISGGERQRLILARSLLKDSSLYILDETLSQVDIAKEREILKMIFDLYNDKTIIYISHRFDNADLFDQKINMEDLVNA